MQMESVDHKKREDMDSGETESDWFGYAYKSGDIIFYYNIKTGEHRWPTNSSCSDNIILQVRTSDVPDVPKELCSVATQTEDYGCVNQCTSMYVDNERQMENRESESNEMKQELSNDEQNTLNNTDVDNNLDEVSEDFEMDESLCTIITKMKRRKELVQSVHPQLSKVHIHNCPSCSRKFDQKSHLDVHVRVHTGEKPYECSYCNKAFALKSNLNVHLRTHTGEKPFECSVCGKAFAQKGALGDHLRIHTGEKPHECSLCHKAFRKKNHLKDHLRIHTSEKPYECSYCQKAFTQKSHLRVHLRIHTGNR